MVNHLYFYCVDEDFGPLFLKFCTYFPYNAKLCLNGNEYAKCQLHKRGIAFRRSITGYARVPIPLPCSGYAMAGRRTDRSLAAQVAEASAAPLQQAGSCLGLPLRYLHPAGRVSSLTQVLDRPLAGRVFFEDVIRENLDIGRPASVQLIFNRRVGKRTPGRFRTRVLTDGVTPSLHVDYKHSRIKQYHKEGQALRTETTINDTYDFARVTAA